MERRDHETFGNAYFDSRFCSSHRADSVPPDIGQFVYQPSALNDRSTGSRVKTQPSDRSRSWSGSPPVRFSALRLFSPSPQSGSVFFPSELIADLVRRADGGPFILIKILDPVKRSSGFKNRQKAPGKKQVGGLKSEKTKEQP